MSTYDLEHREPDCTGRFERRGSHWRCSGCGAVAYDCPDVAEAVAREEVLGELARLLSDSGRWRADA